jgi:S-formylglutathione hydrolase
MGYFGNHQEEWKNHDAAELLKLGHFHPAKILVHQGLSDEYLQKELMTEDLKVSGQDLKLKYVEGYDHSYYFISSFIEEHILHHSNFL